MVPQRPDGAYARIPIDDPVVIRFEEYPDLAAAADELAQRRHGSVPSETKNSRNFFGGRPGWYRHRIGARGEYAYSAYAGVPVDVHTIGRGDAGVDFPGGVQIKSAWSNPDKRPLRNPRLLIQVDQYARHGAAASCFVLALVSATFDTVTLLGSVTREEFDAQKHGPHQFHPRSKPSWFLARHELGAWLPGYPSPAPPPDVELVQASLF